MRGIVHFSRGLRCATATVAVGALFAPLVGVAPASAALPDANHLAGYFAPATGTASVTTRFNVPSLTCEHPDVAFEGNFSGIVVHTATGEVSEVGVETSCIDGVTHYDAIVTINDTQSRLTNPVAPGDGITVTLAVKAHRTRARIEDQLKFNEQRFGAGATATTAGIGAFAVGCAAGGCSPVAQFSSQFFFANDINGNEMAGTKRSFLKSHALVREAKSAPIEGDDSFDVHWVSTCTADETGVC